MIIFNSAFNSFKDLISIWSALVGSVVGYFFGSRPVETLAKRVEVLDAVDDNEAYYESLLDEHEIKIDEASKLASD